MSVLSELGKVAKALDVIDTAVDGAIKCVDDAIEVVHGVGEKTMSLSCDEDEGE